MTLPIFTTLLAMLVGVCLRRSHHPVAVSLEWSRFNGHRSSFPLDRTQQITYNGGCPSRQHPGNALERTVHCSMSVK